jgi:cellulose synthase/poly-beta-1,6-N-acetylglucosamine synthase-like glycosyltransferase
VTILFDVLISGAALAFLTPVTVLFLEVMLAVTSRARYAESGGTRSRIAVLMPAHNEATGIARALLSILPQLEAGDRLLVVADNCSDDTARVALSHGAQVVERFDSARRGKGYALDFGLRHLKPDPPDIVVIVDADCQVADGSIDLLARLCARTSRPVQALNLMFAPAPRRLVTRIAEFAFLVKNYVRPLGLHRLGLPCQLTGTGMAFPWSRISEAKLASGHIVEDLKLGIDLARAGASPLFCPQALVTSPFPASREGVKVQRSRWEHGHLSVIMSDAPRLLAHALITGNTAALALALDLSVPPLALLALILGTLWLGGLILYIASAASSALAITTAEVALFGLAVLLCWARFGRSIISLGSLALAAVYALWKIPLYVKFLVARQMDWVRSKRDSDGS